MLKLRQREDALQRGIELIEWTFDPLEMKNAFFNMERLGAIVRRYVENQYGTTTSPSARRTADGSLRGRMVARQPARRGGHRGLSASARAVEERIEVPADIAVIRREEPAPRARNPEDRWERA